MARRRANTPAAHTERCAQRRMRQRRWAAAASPSSGRTSLGPDLDTARRLRAEGAGDEAQQCRASSTPITTFSVASPEIHVASIAPSAADLGVRMATIGNTLRSPWSADDGSPPSRKAHEQYPVKIRVLEEQRATIRRRSATLTVPSRQRRPVRIDNIATLGARPRPEHDPARRTGSSRSQIVRRRRAGPRARRGVERRRGDVAASACRPDTVVPAAAGRRRSSTRRPPT